MTDPQSPQMAADHAITSRRSIRGFTPAPVPVATIRDILAVASRAPSMTSTQPWRVYVLAGTARDALVRDILAAHDAGEHPAAEYDYYPESWVSPYLDRRRDVGWALYGLLGIGKGDRA